MDFRLRVKLVLVGGVQKILNILRLVNHKVVVENYFRLLAIILLVIR